MLAWQNGLAPGHARDAGGALRLGGVRAEELADAYGTPLLVFDLDVVDTAIASLQAVCAPHGIEIAYAAKAFVCAAFAARLARREVGIDVCSLGELQTAERGGFRAERITLHGAGKNDEELQAAADGRVGRVVVDGIEELEHLGRLAVADRRIDVVLRLNTGVEAATHAFVRTSGGDTKFGIHPRDEAAAAAIVRAHPQLRLAGLHAHIGSNIYQPEAFAANAEALIDAAARFARHRLTVETIVAGGGFGVQMHPDTLDERIDLDATIGGLARRAAARAAQHGIAVPRIGIEPGRSVVALAGTTLYRVLAIKAQTHRDFAIVDGGLFENPRPALYAAAYHVVAAGRAHAGQREMTLCGRLCENDELGTVRMPRDLQRGDLLAMCATGAYTYSMAGNYNRFVRPAVVGLSAGRHRLLIRRETLADVLAKDLAG